MPGRCANTLSLERRILGVLPHLVDRENAFASRGDQQQCKVIERELDRLPVANSVVQRKD